MIQLEDKIREGRKIKLPAEGSWPDTHHRFDGDTYWAVRTAIEAERPLLLRGEPGIGKSQLARAVARALGLPFLCKVVDERSERDDLLYTYDAIARLAEAQIAALSAKKDPNWREALDEKNFVEPGVLWWATNWDSATAQAGLLQKAGRPVDVPAARGWPGNADDKPCGPVVLIDEIDKADPSVPNGLLESLGNHGFPVRPCRCTVAPLHDKPPLVFVTTNEERELPAAFLRRCLVLHMDFPDPPGPFLLERARACPDNKTVSDKVIDRVTADLLADREAAGRLGLPKPGAAEFLDLVRVLAKVPGDDAQLEALGEIRDFAFKKNRGGGL